MSSSFNVREQYFDPSQYILAGWLDAKSWESRDVSSNKFGRNSFKRIKNRMHSWCSAYCTLDVKTSSFKYYKLKRCDDRDLPDLETLSPKVSVQINESDVIDILVDKHGKSDNFIINLDDCNQILLSADSVNLKERWMFSFEHMDDIRDDIALATVNSPRKVFTKQKSSQPRSFSRMPLNESASSKDFEDEDERKLVEMAISCLEDDGDTSSEDEDADDGRSISSNHGPGGLSVTGNSSECRQGMCT